jgi:hypothetical protein
MGRIVLDTSMRPTLVVTFDGEVDDQAFATYIADYRRELDREERYAAILDARRAGLTPSTQRRMQAEMMKEYRDRIASLSVGVCFVIDKPIVRGILTAVLWLQPMPTAHSIEKSLDDAVTWSNARLATAGLSPHPKLASTLREAG